MRWLTMSKGTISTGICAIEGLRRNKPRARISIVFKVLFTRDIEMCLDIESNEV